MLELDEVRASNGAWQLGPVSLALGPGCVAIVGTNGAGKSTLMRCIVGLQTPSHGVVRVAGADAHASRARAKLGGIIGYLPQDPVLPGRTSLEQALHYAAWLKGVARADRRDAVWRAAARFDLSDRLGSRISSLSGGMRRRAALAQAVVHNPMVVVLDEPSVGLDPVQRVELRNVLQELASTSLVLLSTHLVEDVSSLAERILVLRDGRQVFAGSTLDLVNGQSSVKSGDLEGALWRLLTGADTGGAHGAKHA